MTERQYYHMIELKHKCIGVRCPVCGKNVIEHINKFQFSSGADFTCTDCNTPLFSIKKGTSGSNIFLNCFACGETHSFAISRNSFFSDNPASFGCKENKVDVLFIGSFEDVDTALFQLSEEMEILTNQYYSNLEKSYGTFRAAALRILEEKAKEKRIICLCGSYELSLKMSEDGIYLVCPQCGASEFIPTSGEDDIKALMNRRSILIK